MISLFINPILTAIAGVVGLYLVYMHIAVIKKDVKTELFITLPVIIGTLAWISAGYEFLQHDATEASITMQRILMIVSWSWLCINSIRTHINNQVLRGDNDEL